LAISLKIKWLLKNQIMENTYVSFEEAKLLYPDEWLLLGNPVTDENGLNILGGYILYHSKDRKEVCYLGRDLTEGYDKIRLKFTGEIKKMRRLGLMRRL
jgi:hypothetical protein